MVTNFTNSLDPQQQLKLTAEEKKRKKPEKKKKNRQPDVFKDFCLSNSINHSSKENLKASLFCLTDMESKFMVTKGEGQIRVMGLTDINNST